MPALKSRDPKRAKHYDSNKTLDHFFSKKPSTNAPGQRNCHRSIGSRNIINDAVNGTSKPLTNSNEIIIIDSDEETEIVPSAANCDATKKRRLSESSDIEIIDANFPATESTRGDPSKAPCGISNSCSTATNQGSGKKYDFGRPILLATSTSEICGADSTLQFGSPGSLLNPATGNAPTASFSGQQPAEPTEQERDIKGDEIEKIRVDVNMDIDLTLDNAMDEWLMGDDEIEINYQKEDEEEDNEVEFVENALSEKPSMDEMTCGFDFCPSCGERMHGFTPSEVQTHINACLDSESSLDKPQLSITRKTFDSSTSKSLNDKSSNDNNAFSVLMSSLKENEAWKEATATENKPFWLSKADGGRRKAPFYKVLQGMPIAVDAFRYGSIPGVTAYFLSHAHSDHYTNLSSSWKHGPIYCSESTANLIIHMLAVDKKWVNPLPMDVPTVIPDTGGVQVTLIEANHCPGSCLFLFEGMQTVHAGDSTFRSPFIGSKRIYRYLHCGDFRASPKHVLHPAVRNKRIDHVYLDTTYLDSKYTFPPQPLVISACAELSRRLIAGEPTTSNKSMKAWLPSVKPEQEEKGRLLIVVGTYSIGKERIVKAIARAVESKIYCDARKIALLRCQNDSELDALLTSDPLEAIVHLVPLGFIAADRLKIYMERFKGIFTTVIGFRPTGWTYSSTNGSEQMSSVASILSRISQKDFTFTDLQPSPKSTPSIRVYPVPYSEHSSFYELTCFAMSFNWMKMIATVNVGSEHSRGKMGRWVEKWEAEKKKRGADVIVSPRHEDYW